MANTDKCLDRVLVCTSVLGVRLDKIAALTVTYNLTRF